MIIAILTALVLLYLIIMAIVTMGKADAFDLCFMRALHFNGDTAKTQKPKILRLMIDSSALGGDTFLIILTLIIIGISASINNYMLIFSFATVAASGRILGYILKKITNRTRPNLRSNAPQMFTTSFPSVHTMMATCIYLWLGLIMPHMVGLPITIMLNFISIALISTIAFSRLYLGVHWPSDILAGAIAGLVVIFANLLIFV